tara:strand:+ start:41 stop:382 length:342 start_codon:yes stop_codon:yes gene_type:complete
MKNWHAIAYCKRPPERKRGLINWVKMTDMDLNEAEKLRNAGELLMASRMVGRVRWLMVYTDRDLEPQEGIERMQLNSPYHLDRFGDTKQRHPGFYSGRRGKGYSKQEEETGDG